MKAAPLRLSCFSRPVQRLPRRCLSVRVLPFGGKGGRKSSDIDNARSDLVLQELVLFLYQLQYDIRLQQAMTMEAYDAAKAFKAQRDEVDGLLEQFQTAKGPNSGAAPLSDEFINDTTVGLNLRMKLNKAVEEERYEDAASIRDQISKLTDKIESSDESDNETSKEMKFQLGELVQHKIHGYRGVICGWDLGCCESQEWQSKVDISSLTSSSSQPFYHVLVDERDWPPYTRGPPVGYLAEEELDKVEDLENEKTSFSTIRHPFLLRMFLGKDNLGAYIPTLPLRNKYKVNRRDIYPSSDDT